MWLNRVTVKLSLVINLELSIHVLYLYFQAALAAWVTVLRIMGDLPDTDFGERLTVAGVCIDHRTWRPPSLSAIHSFQHTHTRARMQACTHATHIHIAFKRGSIRNWAVISTVTSWSHPASNWYVGMFTSIYYTCYIHTGNDAGTDMAERPLFINGKYGSTTMHNKQADPMDCRQLSLFPYYNCVRFALLRPYLTKKQHTQQNQDSRTHIR